MTNWIITRCCYLKKRSTGSCFLPNPLNSYSGLLSEWFMTHTIAKSLKQPITIFRTPERWFLFTHSVCLSHSLSLSFVAHFPFNLARRTASSCPGFASQTKKLNRNTTAIVTLLLIPEHSVMRVTFSSSTGGVRPVCWKAVAARTRVFRRRIVIDVSVLCACGSGHFELTQYWRTGRSTTSALDRTAIDLFWGLDTWPQTRFELLVCLLALLAMHHASWFNKLWE